MKTRLPELSRFELECLGRLWERGEASVRQIRQDLPGAPGYSTVRKIVERLEEKGAVRRVRLEGKAWVYRAEVAREGMIRREIRKFLNLLFDGSAGPLVAHLADMNELTVSDIGAIEKRLGARTAGPKGTGGKEGKPGADAGTSRKGGKRGER